MNFLICKSRRTRRRSSFYEEEDLCGGENLDLAALSNEQVGNKTRHHCTSESKRQPNESRTVTADHEGSSDDRDSSIEDSGSTSYFQDFKEPCWDDQFSPQAIAFYSRTLGAVGRSLKKVMEVEAINENDSDFCVHHPTCIEEYVQSLIYTEATPECFVIAVIYIDRFLSANHHISLRPSNAQLLFLTALTVAIKYVDDIYFNSEYYSKIGGLVDVQTLNKLELKFLFGLNFDLMVSQKQYCKVERALNLQTRVYQPKKVQKKNSLKKKK